MFCIAVLSIFRTVIAFNPCNIVKSFTPVFERLSSDSCIRLSMDDKSWSLVSSTSSSCNSVRQLIGQKSTIGVALTSSRRSFCIFSTTVKSLTRVFCRLRLVKLAEYLRGVRSSTSVLERFNSTRSVRFRIGVISLICVFERSSVFRLVSSTRGSMF